jgi:ABC-2 type transport system permease protein
LKRSKLSQIWAGILVNAIYEMKNYPVVLLSTVISPLSLLAVVTFVSKGALFGTAIEGGLILSFFSSGIALSADLSHLKNDFKLQDMVVSSPTSSRLYMGGMSLAEIVYSIPSLAILFALLAIYVHPSLTQTAIILIVLGFMFAMAAALGFMLSTISSDVVQSYAFTRLLSLLFTTLPPVYYPISYIPKTFQYFAYLSPTTYAAEITHAATGYLAIPSSLVIADWIILVGVSAIILFIAIKKTRWKEI